MKFLDFVLGLLCSNSANSIVPVKKIDYRTAKLQLADYMVKAFQECPDYYNLTRISASGIIVEFSDFTHAKVTVQKRKMGEKENPRDISLRWIPHLNDILRNIRLDAEYQLEVTRADTLNKLVDLQNQYYYFGDTNGWNNTSSEIVNAYWRYVYKIEHLLCGVKIVDYVEDDGTFTFNVVIDNNFRVPTALA